jgi:hypothetical protein
MSRPIPFNPLWLGGPAKLSHSDISRFQGWIDQNLPHMPVAERTKATKVRAALLAELKRRGPKPKPMGYLPAQDEPDEALVEQAEADLYQEEAAKLERVELEAALDFARGRL